MILHTFLLISEFLLYGLPIHRARLRFLIFVVFLCDDAPEFFITLYHAVVRLNQLANGSLRELNALFQFLLNLLTVPLRQ